MSDTAPRSPALATIESLDPHECTAVLGRHRLCTLSLVDGDVPYAVPLFYGYDGASLYLGLAEGRKTAVLDANPRVCITVTETAAGDRWASVQVTGTAEFLEDEAREAGIRALMAHNQRLRAGEAIAGQPGSGEPVAPVARRHGSGRIMRVRDPVMSGRIRR